MPSCPRCKIIDEDEVGIYHCYSRCARQAYLMGENFHTGVNYDYRKDWLRSLLVELAGQFAIDIAKYALLDNHFHLLVRNRPDIAKRWSAEKVLRRAMKIWPSSFKRQKTYVNPSDPIPKGLLNNKALVAEMRKRLSSISWLMKTACERIAKRANKEDGVTGVFWDGRFHCERLLDEAAVLACSVYIDLNLIRAGKFKTPETSKHTSAYDRIKGLRARRRERKEEGIAHDGFLCPFNTRGDYPGEDLAARELRASNDGIVEFPIEVYFQLLDRTGRGVRPDKRGAIPAELAPLLERCGIPTENWLPCVESFAKRIRKAVGNPEQLRQHARRIGQKWLHGITQAKELFTLASGG